MDQGSRLSSPKSPGRVTRSSQHFQMVGSFIYLHNRNLTQSEVLTHILSYLPASSLSVVALLSRRFHNLVTTPHAWRMAFSRFFPGADALEMWDSTTEVSDDGSENLRSEKRIYTRLTALASWRSEYILRTRLLRSLARGKPVELQGFGTSGPSRSGSGHSGNAQITYNSNLVTTVNHLRATFGTGLNKRLPRFIHGADESGATSSSDPAHGKVDRWGFADHTSFASFAEQFPGEAEYGLGEGDVVGVPNTMDVSQPFGMVYALGFPGGMCYFRSVEEQRGRGLALASSTSHPELGIPSIDPVKDTKCSVWIAKNAHIPSLSDGVIGILLGCSSGTVLSYSLGTDNLRERRLERGELTARWVVSPGIPIIAFAVDENFSAKRQASHRIYILVLNALGEVFYLTDFPTRTPIDCAVKLSPQGLERLAWETGRTVHWTLVEPTRRIPRPDPFNTSNIDASYSPRSSWNGMGLSTDQVIAETREIESHIRLKPKHFRKVCEGWDMRRRFTVDFANDDRNDAGETLLIARCGFDEGQPASVTRITRCKFQNPHMEIVSDEDNEASVSPTPEPSHSSLIGDSFPGTIEKSPWSFNGLTPARRSSALTPALQTATSVYEEWRTSILTFGGLKNPQLMTMAMDMSTFALLTISEDPLLTLNGSSVASSPLSSPLGQMPLPSSPSDVPGQRARFFAAGTKTGAVLIWNIRAPISSSIELKNNIGPVRIIHTDSPQISCLALSSLYLVHGGNDGLVQAWDPLASNTMPIRTLNSRFSSRARRRLVQAEASPQGIGVNLFAAGAVCLDPDPTVLRGIVSLGTHLRYWSYSSSAADQYKSSKRRPRRSKRGSNHDGDRFLGTGRGALKEYITNERLELEREKESRRKEDERLTGRFGINLLGPGASQDEIMAYATLLSEEAAISDDLRRKSESDGSGDLDLKAGNNSAPADLTIETNDAELEEAIRLSLLDNGGYNADSEPNSKAIAGPISIHAKKHKSLTAPILETDFEEPLDSEAEDLDFVLQLSLAEQESREAVRSIIERKGKEREY